MATMPQQGQQLPDVEFVTEGGEKLSAGDLEGEKTVLYFYPKDDTRAAPRRRARSGTACPTTSGGHPGLRRLARLTRVAPALPREVQPELPAPHRRGRPRGGCSRGVAREREVGEPRHLSARFQWKDRQGLPRGLSRDARGRDPRGRRLAMSPAFRGFGEGVSTTPRCGRGAGG